MPPWRQNRASRQANEPTLPHSFSVSRVFREAAATPHQKPGEAIAAPHARPTLTVTAQHWAGATPVKPVSPILSEPLVPSGFSTRVSPKSRRGSKQPVAATALWRRRLPAGVCDLRCRPTLSTHRIHQRDGVDRVAKTRGHLANCCSLLTRKTAKEAEFHCPCLIDSCGHSLKLLRGDSRLRVPRLPVWGSRTRSQLMPARFGLIYVQ